MGEINLSLVLKEEKKVLICTGQDDTLAIPLLECSINNDYPSKFGFICSSLDIFA